MHVPPVVGCVVSRLHSEFKVTYEKPLNLAKAYLERVRKHELRESLLEIQQLTDWMFSLANQYGYLGIFIISLLGALSIFFPIPYTVVIFTLGGYFDPVLIGIVAGTGAAIGEFSGYVLGLYGRRLISPNRRRKMEFMLKIFNRLGPVAIFVFALTPLPDDLLFIPLGIMQYNLLRALIPALIGKMCMNFMVAYSGRYAIEIIRNIFGEGSDWIAALLGMLLGIALFIVVMVVMFKVDWEKLFEEYEKKRAEREKAKLEKRERPACV